MNCVRSIDGEAKVCIYICGARLSPKIDMWFVAGANVLSRPTPSKEEKVGITNGVTYGVKDEKAGITNEVKEEKSGIANGVKEEEV